MADTIRSGFLRADSGALVVAGEAGARLGEREIARTTPAFQSIATGTVEVDLTSGGLSFTHPGGDYYLALELTVAFGLANVSHTFRARDGASGGSTGTQRISAQAMTTAGTPANDIFTLVATSPILNAAAGTSLAYHLTGLPTATSSITSYGNLLSNGFLRAIAL